MNNQLRAAVDINTADLLCFSHLRWDFVFQRPQHLMSRFAKTRRVFFVEEPVAGDSARVDVHVDPQTGVHIAVPVLPNAVSKGAAVPRVEKLLAQLLTEYKVRDYVSWFYTPMAVPFTTCLRPTVTVYDCMDELSLFRGAPPDLVTNEKILLARADLVFTGGLSLFEAKCEQHRRVYAFPSSVDVGHFAQARRIAEAPDQKHIPHPRIGYAGVIDERMDLALLERMADKCPEWHQVMLGPVVKIDPGTLPQRPNIHYLGMKPYQALPSYFAGWDVAMLPFALNEATRFISPTKTPEYLAAGLPVVSTPVRDVVRSYGELGLVRIGANAEEFCVAAHQALNQCMSLKWRERADQFLATLSWDVTWNCMDRLMAEVVESRNPNSASARVMRAGGGLPVALGA